MSLKSIAQKFKPLAYDKKAVQQLALDTMRAHPGDEWTRELCDRMMLAEDGAAVLAVIAEVEAG